MWPNASLLLAGPPGIFDDLVDLFVQKVKVKRLLHVIIDRRFHAGHDIGDTQRRTKNYRDILGIFQLF